MTLFTNEEVDERIQRLESKVMKQQAEINRLIAVVDELNGVDEIVDWLLAKDLGGF